MKNSFLYVVDYDYNTRYSCHESGCDKEGICRCSEIYNERITNIDLVSLTEHFYSNIVDTKSKAGKRNQKLNKLFYGGDEIDKYCINRILTIYKVWDKNLWYINTCGGYYGEEIDSIILKEDLFQKIIEEIDIILLSESISEKVKYIIQLEYGEVLDNLKNQEFEIIEISGVDIDFNLTNPNHLKLVKEKNLDFYKDFPYICGIVKKVENKFKIIDGYHRLFTNKNKTIKVISNK